MNRLIVSNKNLLKNLLLFWILQQVKKSIEKFNKFYEAKTFNELVNTINLHNQKYPTSYLDTSLELISKHTEDSNEFEEALLKTYNAFSYIFGQEYGYKVVRGLVVKEDLKYDPNETKIAAGLAWNLKWGRQITIEILEEALNYNQKSVSHSWKKGFFSSSNKYNTFLHEYGHAIDHILEIKFPFYEEIDLVLGLDPESTKKSTVTDRYKIESCNNLAIVHKPCSYKISSRFNKNQISNSLINYSVTDANTNSRLDLKRRNIIVLLQKFILEKIKNLKIPGDTEAEKDKFINTMLAKIFINSDYGRSNKDDWEVPSEGFAYWLLTDERFRDKAWKIWNEFYLEYLPAWKNSATYLKNSRKDKK